MSSYLPATSPVVTQTVQTGGGPPPGTLFDYLVTILMENNGFSNIIGPAPFCTSLASQYSLLTNYNKTNSPSEGNYNHLIAAADYGFTNDAGYAPNRSSADTIVQRIVASGRTVMLFAEDASGSGTPGFNPPRGGDHFAFITYTQNNSDPRVYQNYQNASSPNCPELIAHLNSANPANYIWLSPNDADNMHDTPVSFGDNYLQQLVSAILGTTLFNGSKRAALNVVWDENGSQIASIWAGTIIKRGFTSSTFHDHDSIPKTIETAWGLATLGQGDVGATAITEVFA